jgi:hypothetical protein
MDRGAFIEISPTSGASIRTYASRFITALAI